MMPNIKSKTDFKKIDFKAFGEKYPALGEKGVRDLWNKRKEAVTAEDKAIIKDIRDNSAKEVTLPLDNKSEEGLENRTLDNMRKILELSDIYVSLIRPNDTDLVKPIADDLSTLVSDYDPRTVTYTDKNGKEAKRISGTREIGRAHV